MISLANRTMARSFHQQDGADMVQRNGKGLLGPPGCADFSSLALGGVR
jgi:hypothetical protein